MQRTPHHLPICWIANTIRLYGLTKMIDLGIGLFRAHKNTDVAWRVLVCSCAAFSLLKVYYYFQYKDLSNVAEVQLDQIKSEHPLSINERLLEHEGVCDAMHVFLPRDPYSMEPEEPPCECCHQHHGKPKTTEVNLLKTLVIELMLVFVLYLGMTALLDVFKENKKETVEETDARLSRRCSLAEYANMKHSRKNSIAIGSAQSSGFLRRDSVRPKPTLNRYESLGTAYTRMRRESQVAGTQNLVTANDSPNTPPLFVARTPLKLLGARPPPLIRRSSFPANVLLEGQIQQNRRGSMDSEDDSSPDSRRRCRLIRRH